jgi:S-(hydroxymethyl)glutathione dehydrogenase/alcohol dehydrogenase
MRQTYDAACRGGVVTFIGGLNPDLQLPLPAHGLHRDARRILGCVYGSAQVRRDMPRLIALVETGRLDLEAMVSRRIDLDEIQDAFTAMEAGEVIRSVIVPR